MSEDDRNAIVDGFVTIVNQDSLSPVTLLDIERKMAESVDRQTSNKIINILSNYKNVKNV